MSVEEEQEVPIPRKYNLIMRNAPPMTLVTEQDLIAAFKGAVSEDLTTFYLYDDDVRVAVIRTSEVLGIFVGDATVDLPK